MKIKIIIELIPNLSSALITSITTIPKFIYKLESGELENKMKTELNKITMQLSHHRDELDIKLGYLNELGAFDDNRLDNYFEFKKYTK